MASKLTGPACFSILNRMYKQQRKQQCVCMRMCMSSRFVRAVWPLALVSMFVAGHSHFFICYTTFKGPSTLNIRTRNLKSSLELRRSPASSCYFSSQFPTMGEKVPQNHRLFSGNMPDCLIIFSEGNGESVFSVTMIRYSLELLTDSGVPYS